MNYSVERREVRTIVNRNGRPAMGKQVRWYVLRDGEPVEQDMCGYCQPGGIWFVRKRDAVDEMFAQQVKYNREGK